MACRARKGRPGRPGWGLRGGAAAWRAKAWTLMESRAKRDGAAAVDGSAAELRHLRRSLVSALLALSSGGRPLPSAPPIGVSRGACEPQERRRGAADLGAERLRGCGAAAGRGGSGRTWAGLRSQAPPPHLLRLPRGSLQLPQDHAAPLLRQELRPPSVQIFVSS